MLESKDESVTVQQTPACQKVLDVLSVLNNDSYTGHLLAVWDCDGDSYSVKNAHKLERVMSLLLPWAVVDFIDGEDVVVEVDLSDVSIGGFLLIIHQLQEAYPECVPGRVGVVGIVGGGIEVYLKDGEFFDAKGVNILNSVIGKPYSVAETALGGTEPEDIVA